MEDDVFPDDEYILKHDLFLQELGMKIKVLQWDKIICKAREIAANQKKQDANLLIERSKILIKVMTFSLTALHIDEYTDDQRAEIIQIHFLPVRLASNSENQLPWFSQEKVFSSGKECYTLQYTNIISSSAPILDFNIDERLAKFLGVDQVPTFQQALAQMEEIELKYKVLTNKKETQEVCGMLRELFTFLFDNYKSECCPQVFSNKNIIYDNDRKYLATPEEIFFDTKDELVKVSGHMYKVATDLTGDWKIKSVLQNIGVKESPDISDYVMVLHKVKAQCQSQSVPEPTLNAIVHSVIPKIALSPNLFENTKDIFVPDEHGIMRKATEVCFKDADWIKAPEKLILAHPEMTLNHCEILGVKSFRKQYLLNNGVGIAFGQRENLTRRIKNLLRAYKKEDVLKELLQNADDSHATEVEFMFDCRNHNTKTVLSDEWKKLQGPALIITNNGHFTENDLIAIQKLGEGSKSRDCLKTGRYGVGFNAVYNITDCPTMHVCMNNVSYLCIFDPNLHYNIGGTIEKPGQQIHSGKIKEEFKDVYDAHFNNGDDLSKTLFRLPLRTEEMAKMSEISDEETTVERIEKFFRDMYKYIWETLLFLVNIKKVRFTILKVKNDKLVKTCEEFAVFPYDLSQSELHRKVKVIVKYIKNPSFKEVTMINHKACIHHVSNGKDCCQKHYHLIERIGFSEKEVVTVDEFREFYLFPKGAVAKAIDDVKCKHCSCIGDNHVKCKLKCSSKVSNIFCTLPLSAMSNLPVIVNGNFLLEHEARRGLYIGTSGLEIEWNRNLLSYCVYHAIYYYLSNSKKILRLFKRVKSQRRISKNLKQKFILFSPSALQTKEKIIGNTLAFCFTKKYLEEMKI